MLVVLPFRQADIRERYRIKIVIGQCDVTIAKPPQLHDFLYHCIGGALPGLLSVRAPDGAEGTMFGAAAHRLHGSPHVTAMRQQVPTGRFELFGPHPSAFINLFESAIGGVPQSVRPSLVTVAFYHRVSAASFKSFF